MNDESNISLQNEQNNKPNQNNDQKAVSDLDIRKKIHDALSPGWFSKGFEEVTFEVNNGNIDLGGYVDTIDDKHKVEEKVKKIDGVKNINNQIQVKESVKKNNDSKAQNR